MSVREEPAARPRGSATVASTRITTSRHQHCSCTRFANFRARQSSKSQAPKRISESKRYSSPSAPHRYATGRQLRNAGTEALIRRGSVQQTNRDGVARTSSRTAVLSNRSSERVRVSAAMEGRQGRRRCRAMSQPQPIRLVRTRCTVQFRMHAVTFCHMRYN